MIDINYIEKKLLINIKKDDLEVFNKLEKGRTNSIPICYTFENWDDEIAVDKIYSAKKIVGETKKYNKIALRDDIPIIPAHCFIFAIDIGGDPIIYDSITGNVLYAGEVTFYEQVVILQSLIEFYTYLIEVEVVSTNKEEKINISLTTSNINDILEFFNISKNENLIQILYSLSNITYSPFNYQDNGRTYTTSIGEIYNKDLIIEKTEELNNDKFLAIGCTTGGFIVALNLDDYKLYMIDDFPVYLLDMDTFKI